MNSYTTNPQSVAKKLSGQLFLSSMMGITNGKWCAEHCKSASMVQLGAFVLDGPAYKSGHYYPPSEEKLLTSHLKKEFDTFKQIYNQKYKTQKYPLLSANIFLCEEKSVITSAKAFMSAGGDVYELNVHGGIGHDKERGTGQCMFYPEHVEKLYRWVQLLTQTGVILIVKARAGVIPDYGDHLAKFEEYGVFGFHINVRDEKHHTQDLKCLEKIRKQTKLFLLASGYVRDVHTAKALFNAGADAVGIAEAVRNNSDIFDTINRALKP
jgi:tRNA-dihydrouridine synthase